MTDTSQTPASWLPSLETFKAVKWMQMAKYGALALGLVLIYGVFQNVSAWFKPAPPPQVVYRSEVTADEFKALQSQLQSLASKSSLESVAGRVLKLEDKVSSKKK